MIQQGSWGAARAVAGLGAALFVVVAGAAVADRDARAEAVAPKPPAPVASMAVVTVTGAAPAGASLGADELAAVRTDVKSGDRAREQMAVLRLGRADPRPADTVALCAAVLKTSKAPLSRFYAAMVLAREPKGVKTLLAALKDPSPDVRGMAAEALGALKDKTAAKPLEKAMLEDPDDEVAAYAAAALVSMGAASPDLVAKRLTDLLTRKGPPPRTRTREELKRVAGYGPFLDIEGGVPLLTRTLATVATRTTRDALVAASKHSDPEVRVAAAEALGSVSKPGDFDAVTALEKLREDRDEGVRAAAMKALVTIGYSGKPPGPTPK
ncbi:MAG TPA: HEAT repeat domain-containing protein [Myxococcota bacterium]|jgi:HEAT repeat protein|nr:HEAT repeat domain-containing protein [Myxococcota bacterium]